MSQESYGTLLAPIIIGKLPAETRRNMARDHTSVEWTVDDLKAAVLKEIRILETGLYTADQPANVPNSSRTPMATASFYTGIRGTQPNTPINSDKKKLACVYCRGSHSLNARNVVTDYQKRLEIVKKANICFNCLGHHKISQCGSNFRCKRCKHKHHTSLCKPNHEEPKPRDEDRDDQGSKDSRPEQPKNMSHATLTPVSYHTTQNRTTTEVHPACLLQTAIAPVSVGCVRVHANILFDEGAQRSFITEDLAAKLNLQPVSSKNIIWCRIIV